MTRNRLLRLMLAGGLSGGGAAGGITDPTDIAGLAAWWDRSDISTLFQDSTKLVPVLLDGDVIGATEDKSGNGHDLLQATAANKPTYRVNVINGLGVVRYVTNKIMATASFQQFASKRGCLFVVFLPHLSGDTSPFYSTFDATNPDWQAQITVAGAAKNKYYDGSFYVASAYDTDDVVQMQEWHRTTNTNIQFYRNSSGESIAVGDSQPAANVLREGGNSGSFIFVGDIGETVLYDDISAADRLLVENYLNNKWAVY